MVLHNLPDLKASLDRLLNLLSTNGKILLIDFNDSSEKILRESVNPIHKSDRHFIKGIVKLASGIKVESNIYFHKEKDIESILKRKGSFKKSYLGDIFVVYDFQK